MSPCKRLQLTEFVFSIHDTSFWYCSLLGFFIGISIIENIRGVSQKPKPACQTYFTYSTKEYLNFATQFIKVSFHTQSLFSLFWPSKSGLGPSVGFHCSSCVFEVYLRFNLSQDPAFDQYSTLSGLYMGFLE